LNFYERGRLLASRGKYRQAIADFNEALGRGSAPADRPIAGAAHVARATSHFALGAYDDAIADFTLALQADENFYSAYFGRGLALMKQRKWHEATRDLDKATRFGTNTWEAHLALAIAWHALGRLEDAINHYNNTLDIRPACIPALYWLARVQSSSAIDKIRDGDAALRLAKKMCDLTASRDYRSLDVLGMSYASRGQFSEALSAATRASALCEDNALKNDIARRLELYRMGSAFREEPRLLHFEDMPHPAPLIGHLGLKLPPTATVIWIPNGARLKRPGVPDQHLPVRATLITLEWIDKSLVNPPHLQIVDTPKGSTIEFVGGRLESIKQPYLAVWTHPQ
jgi:tetratricopeptide (TPR) repeat protein